MHRDIDIHPAPIMDGYERGRDSQAVGRRATMTEGGQGTRVGEHHEAKASW